MTDSTPPPDRDAPTEDAPESSRSSRRSRRRRTKASEARTQVGLLNPGDQVGSNYKVEAFLAAGGMSKVWRARHLGFDRAVAFKVPPHEVCENEDASELLLKEARKLVQLEHPGIARVLDCGRIPSWSMGPLTYIAMELLEGPTLARHLRDHGPLSLDEAVAILTPIAEALDHAHQQGYVHRDVKPGNVMFTADPAEGGVPKLIDFGLAGRLEDAVSRSGLSVASQEGTSAGTPPYMSPEQIRARKPRPAMDVWGLAVVAYEMLADRLPFPGPWSQRRQQILHEDPDAVDDEDNPGLDEATAAHVNEVLRWGLSKDPEDRPGSLGEFVRRLGEMDASEAAPTSAPAQEQGPPDVVILSSSEVSTDPDPPAPSPSTDPVTATRAEPKPEPDSARPAAPPTPASSSPDEADVIEEQAQALSEPRRNLLAVCGVLTACTIAAVGSFSSGGPDLSRQPRRVATTPTGPGYIRLESRPSGAKVFILKPAHLRGTSLGKTGSAKVHALQPGNYTLRYVLEDHLDVDLDIRVQAGQATTGWATFQEKPAPRPAPRASQPTYTPPTKTRYTSGKTSGSRSLLDPSEVTYEDRTNLAAMIREFQAELSTLEHGAAAIRLRAISSSDPRVRSDFQKFEGLYQEANRRLEATGLARDPWASQHLTPEGLKRVEQQIIEIADALALANVQLDQVKDKLGLKR